MADVSVVLEVQDRMTGALDRINNSVNSVTHNFETFDHATDEVIGKSFSSVTNSVDDVTAGIKRSNAELDRMEQNIKDNQRETNDLGGLWGRVAGIVATVFAGYQVKQAIDYASDLVEVQNVVDVTFGDSAETVNKWSKEALQAYGLNELSAKRYSSTLGAMMKSSGLAGDEVMDMSMKMTELAGDMASFYNLSGDIAFEKIKSGISGETEPLKALGINMSDANLQAYAYATGINKLTKDMSQAEKVQLRYNYLLSVTADAQGDFSRTSDSYSNQTKLLAENWKAFTGELATNLLPALTVVVQAMNNMITVAQAVYDFISAHWSVFGPIIFGVVGALAVFIGYLALVKIWSLLCAGAQAVWNAIMMANPIMLIVMAIIAVIGAIVAFCNWIAEATGVCESGLGVIVGAFMTAGAFIYNTITGVINAIIQSFYNMFVTPIASVIEWVVNAFNGGFDSVGDALLNLIGKMVSWLLDFAKVATKILDSIFGTDMTAGLTGLQDKLNAMGKNEDAVTYKIEAPQFERMDYGEAFDTGASWGDKASNAISERFSFDQDDAVTNAVNANTGATTAGVDAINANNTKNANKLKKSVDISKENLVYLRDIAEKEAINQFTTAEVKVDMTNNNTVNKGLDLNSMINQLSSGVKEAMQVCADGVY